MNETTRILVNISSTEPCVLSEVLTGLGDHAPRRGHNEEWRVFFLQLESLEAMGLVKIERLNGRIQSLMLTSIGAERAREALRGR